MKRIVCVLGLLFLSAGTLWAQSRVGTSAAPFLTLGTGARGSALGHAYTAMATGADALFWNPGGAARLGEFNQRGSLFLSNYQWVADIGYYAAGLTIPAGGAGVVGFSLATVEYGRMPVRTVYSPEGTGETFGARDLSIGLSYARPLTESFYIGGTVKYIRQSIRDMVASTGAVDIGFVLDTDYFGGVVLGASIRNFGGKMQMKGINTDVFVDIDPNNSGSNPNLPATLKTSKWDLPLSFRLGVAVKMAEVQAFQVHMLADADQTVDNDLNSDLGLLARYQTRTVKVAFRMGYRDLMLNNVDSHWTFGGGVALRITGTVSMAFDFAVIPFERLGSTRLLDFRLYF